MQSTLIITGFNILILTFCLVAPFNASAREIGEAGELSCYKSRVNVRLCSAKTDVSVMAVPTDVTEELLGQRTPPYWKDGSSESVCASHNEVSWLIVFLPTLL